MVDRSLNGAAALSQLARRCASLTVTDSLRETARARLYDCSIAALVGRLLADSQSVRRLPADRHSRLRYLVASVRATEIDDIAIDGCVTAGSVVIPTALHLADTMQTAPDNVWSAIVAGYDAMIGFASTIDGANILYRGIWPTLAAAPIGACAVAARLAGFDEKKTCNAMALAIGRSAWWSDRTGPRWLMIGDAAVDGVLAAEAADAGFAGSADVLDVWAEAAGIGLRYANLCPATRARILDVDIKPFPTARQGLCAVEAFRSLQGKEPIRPDDRVIVRVPQGYLAMIGRDTLPTTRMETLVSVAFQIALAAVAPEQLYDVVRGQVAGIPSIVSQFSRISVEHDPSLDHLFPAAWPGAVTISGADGRQREAVVTVPQGVTDSGSVWALLDTKADRLAGANGIEKAAFDQLRSVAQSRSPSEVMRLLD